MYEILFEKYPQTQAMFANASNQNVKLARAIIAYAENIDALENLTDTIERLANKHARTGVKPEHYPMVADAFMTAMVDVLGTEVVTDEVAKAWGEAYHFLAQTLQTREAEILNQHC